MVEKSSERDGHVNLELKVKKFIRGGKDFSKDTSLVDSTRLKGSTWLGVADIKNFTKQD